MQNSLPALLCSRVRAQPEAEALVQAGRRVTYGQLWRAVEAVAAHLCQAGLRPGERVALLLDASADYVAAYYAILASGGVVVALDTAASAQDIEAWLHHCDARFVISDERRQWLKTSSAHAWLSLAQMDVWAEPAVPALQLAETAGGEALASIIYTSGTTGSPKGVMLSHRNLVSNVLAVADYLQLSAADRVLHALPFHYSYGNSVLHTHLAVGATVVIEQGFAYPHRLLERMVLERVSGFSGVPASYALLLARVQLDSYSLPFLRYLTLAGGPMAPANIARIGHLLPQARFFVMYGQTEATARLTYLPPAELPGRLGAVGIPIANTEIRVVDNAARPLPAGKVGNVCARGPGIMQGYWKDPEATQRVLRDGWLWTGDLGYLDSDGFLYLQGRTGDLIKSGAYRISPTEVEEAVAAFHGVSEVVAAGVPDPLLGEVIKIWVVPHAGAGLSARQVLAHCRDRLPLYKVPKAVEFVEALPRTASGKVQRIVLVSLDALKQGEQGSVDASKTALEQGCFRAG